MNQNLMTFLAAVEKEGNRRIKKDVASPSPIDEGQYGDNLLVASENGIIIDYARYVSADGEKTTFWRKYSTLVMRDLALALRDPSLYYMQFTLVLISGLLVGSAYYKAIHREGRTLFNVSAGLLWVLFLMAYIPIFKVKIQSSSSNVLRFVQLISCISTMSFLNNSATSFLLTSCPCPRPSASLFYRFTT